MNKERVFRRTEAINRGMFTVRQWDLARDTGYIGAVKAPHVSRMSTKVCVIAQSEYNNYLKREKQWRSLYLDSVRTAEHLGMFSKRSTWENSWLIGMIKTGKYMDIVAPLPYRFKGVHGIFYHIEDLHTLRRFVSLLHTGKLNRNHVAYNHMMQCWEPKYVMPVDEQFSDRYTDTTNLLVYNRQNMTTFEIARLRLYREGSKHLRRCAPRSVKQNTMPRD